VGNGGQCRKQPHLSSVQVATLEAVVQKWAGLPAGTKSAPMHLLFAKAHPCL
jgi:hypothetical protein